MGPLSSFPVSLGHVQEQEIESPFILSLTSVVSLSLGNLDLGMMGSFAVRNHNFSKSIMLPLQIGPLWALKAVCF